MATPIKPSIVFVHGIWAGRGRMLPHGVECFVGDLSEQEQELVWATHAGPAATLFDEKVEGTAWRSKPSWYIVAANDRTLQPALQRFIATRMGAITSELERGHVPMLSRRSLVADVIRSAAHAVEQSAVAVR